MNNNDLQNQSDFGEKIAPKSPKTHQYSERRTNTGERKAPSRNYKKQTPPAVTASSDEPAKPQRYQRKDTKKISSPLRIIPLGGLNEIGKNMTVFECGNDMFIIDCGLAFPDSEMLGVDIVIPDFTYVERNREKLKGIVLTHGHEDHIGGLPYFLKKINVPVYGTKLTLALVESKLVEHGIQNKVKLIPTLPRQRVKFGCMEVEFIRVNHSIPDSIGVAISTPAGTIVHTGDFKIDYTPINGDIINLARFCELGKKGVLALMADSTNAERPGFTQTERTVGESFNNLFIKAEGKRIIIATFSSNIHRIQQIVNCAEKYGRKIAVFGRSMVNVINTAIELGYLKLPKDILIDIEDIDKYKNEEIVLITTGSQGEPMSALTRMAMNDHKKVSITAHDFIIISATPIPGNEKYVTKVVNELMKCGAEVVYEKMYEVHVSGHACQEELKLMLAMTKPKFFIPVHGEYKHLKKHAHLAVDMGIPEENIVIGEIGNVIETDGKTLGVVSQVPAGRTLVDGLGVGDVGSIVLRDRKHLAQDGIIIVVVALDKSKTHVISGPEIISRGFIYVRESEELIDEARQIVSTALKRCSNYELREWNTLKSKLRDVLSEYIYAKTKRSPMILPIIMEM